MPAPIVVLLLPLLAGIFFQATLPIPYLWATFLVFGTLLYLYLEHSISVQWRYHRRYGYLLAVLLCWFGIGLLSVVVRAPESPPSSFSPTHYPYYTARITSLPVARNSTVACQVEQLSYIDTAYREHPVRIPILLYIDIDNDALSLFPDEVLVVRNRLTEVASSPHYTPSYAASLAHQGIFYTGYLRSEDWRFIGRISDSDGLKSNALDLRRQLLLDIAHYPQLSPTAQALLASLVLGDRSELSNETRQHFQLAGLSHLLAVSGLHVGIVLLLLSALLYPLRYLRQQRLYLLLLLLTLWGYAYLTGLSPSVVRACVMASVVLIGKLLRRRSSSLNALALAAVGMLLYNPYYLFDAGFRLSFLAVWGILALYPLLYGVCAVRSRAIGYLWSVLVVTCCAQLVTLPLTLYYFHSLPLLSLVANFVVLPLLPLVVGVGGVLIVCTACGVMLPLLATLLEQMLTMLEAFSATIANLPGGSITDLHIGSYTLWATMAVLILLTVAIYLRSSRGVIVTLLLAVGLLTIDAVLSTSERVMVTLDPALQDKAARLHALGSERLMPFDSQLIAIGERRLLVVNDSTWQRRTTSAPMQVDILYLTRGYGGSFEHLLSLFRCGQVVIGSTVHPQREASILRICQREGIPCHSLRRQGSLSLTE